ncbi:hypothetical protein [Desulfovibrio gilichinskyi]|uniref:Uncharacterized protein n=1 Tax=Desulfovibrio gilichinskyi TaxID=1519643 RepID=A0A1X7ETQ9_9BACT|nr:hypothetical protein [Desulfovibrio gilichinskyi]SMF40037.1 hypothetical protein SAMN06295933_3378 [Desulfovibrio gilichinskyi]
MRNFFLIILLVSIICIPVSAKCGESETSQKSNIAHSFKKLSEVESALKTMGVNLDNIAGSDSTPDRTFALQDLANLCRTSRLQVHGLNSIYSVISIVKNEKRFETKEAKELKQKSIFANHDFRRRQVFVNDIVIKTSDQKLKDLAYILEAQLNIILKQLKLINIELK